MKGFKDICGGIVTALCELMIGILLLFNPIGFTASIIRILGIILLAFGIANIVDYFRNAPQAAARERKLASGILAVAGGLFCTVNPHWFVATFPVLTILYGIGLLVFGVVKVETAVDMFRLKTRRWGICAISAALSLVCAVIIIFNPLSSTVALWMFIAISLIVEAVIDFISVFIPAPKDDREV